MIAYEYILVGLVVLVCLVYTVRKVIGILRGRDSDGCAFCTSDSKGKSCRSCLGCSQQSTCKLADQKDQRR